MDSLLKKHFKHKLSRKTTDERFSKATAEKQNFGKKIISGTLALLLTLPNVSVLNALDNSKKSKTETVAEQQQSRKMSTGTKCAIGAGAVGIVSTAYCVYYNHNLKKIAYYVRRQRNIKLMRDWIQKAIDNKIYINEKDKRGFTPLHYAAFLGNNDAIDDLVNRNASLTETDDFGHTAAMIYIINRHNDLETFKKLVNNGNLNVINKYDKTGTTVLGWANSYNGLYDDMHMSSIIDYLSELTEKQQKRPEDLENPSSGEESGDTTSESPTNDYDLFKKAIDAANSNSIEAYIKNERDVNAPREVEASPEEAYTPLVYAIDRTHEKFFGNTWCIELLLNQGAIVTMRCLRAAIDGHRYDILKLLLKRDKNRVEHLNMSVNSGNLGYISLLNYCVINGSSPLCKLLIEYGAYSNDSEQSVLYTATITRNDHYYLFVYDMLEYYGEHQEYRPSARDMTEVCNKLRNDCLDRKKVLTLVEQKFKDWYSTAYNEYIASHDVSEQNPQTI